MPIHAKKNLYRGVNAHLNSYLQNATGRWRSFHTEHIIDLRKVIEVALPPGYVALSDQSLQVDETAPKREEHEISAVAIYRPRTADDLGKPCVIVELLSPSNKFPNPGYEAYITKRADVLQAGLCLVEIDYIHQLRSHIEKLPRYPDQQIGAFPYVVVVNEPYPTFEAGSAKIFGFHVDDPLPRVRVPLLGDDSFILDLPTAYAATYEARRLHEQVVDYEQLPTRFETYAEFDQQRIRERMAQIRQESA